MGRLTLLLMLFAGSGSAAPRAYPVTPAGILKEAETRGGRAVLDELYASETRWRVVRRGLATGQAAWLDVARTLKEQGARGAASQEVTAAVADALAVAPVSVLRVLEPPLDADNVCSMNTIEDSLGPDYAAASAKVAARIRAVRSVKDPALQSRRDECLDFLNELSQALKDHRDAWFER